MKKSLYAVLMGLLLAPSFVHAAVNLTLDPEVEVLVVEGENTPINFMNKLDFTLKNGRSQLVIRLSKLIQQDSGEYEKFKSDPIILDFDATDTQLTISPSRNFNVERQVKDFKSNPSFVVKTANGQLQPSTQNLLPKARGLVPDYAAALASYNRKHAIAVSETVAVNAPSHNPMQPRAKPIASSAAQQDNSLILLQADFLRLPTDKQQAFLDWAKQQQN